MTKNSRFRALNLEMGDIWLMKNDKYYSDKSSNKTKGMDYPYLTPKQFEYRASKEVAFSNVSFEVLENEKVDRHLINFPEL
jgi:hypothetical protein